MKVYLDTNIYLDYLLDRRGRTGRRLGDMAERVFRRIFSGEVRLVISDWVKMELQNHIEGNNVKVMFALMKNIEEIRTEKCDIEEAKRISRENFDDALHAVLARKARADFLVTRNTDHFREFSGLVNTAIPERLFH